MSAARSRLSVIGKSRLQSAVREAAGEVLVAVHDDGDDLFEEREPALAVDGDEFVLGNVAP